MEKPLSTFEDKTENENRIKNQFDTLMRKVLLRTASNYRKEMGRKIKREVSLNDLSQKELNTLYTTESYITDYEKVTALGVDVEIKNLLLAEALKALTETQQYIILSRYWLDMSDEEIGKNLEMVRSTVYRNRKAGLSKIKSYIEKTEENDGTNKNEK